LDLSNENEFHGSTNQYHFMFVKHILRVKYSTLTPKEAKLARMDRVKNSERKQCFDMATSGLPTLQSKVEQIINGPLKRDKTTIFQMNIGKLCNLSCHHCHVESGPTKTVENMNRTVVEQCLKVIGNSKHIDTVDLTGGAPEMNPFFRHVITQSRKMGKNVMDRCNLTILLEKGYQDLPEFFATNKVHVVASLPCYTLPNVDGQRGKGVFNASIEGLRLLNAVGYGKTLPLSLVYNPGGAVLPGSQLGLEKDYKRELDEGFGVKFTNLLTITNMPIKRFADDLIRKGEYIKYMELLVNSFNPQSIEGLMCKNTLNVAWDGKLFDCDFNGALDLPIKSKKTIFDIERVEDLDDKEISTDKHCFGCTAGQGSSCGGALVK
jgi:radical SAM/Cys-rich protein